MSGYFLFILFIAYAASGLHTSVLGAAWPTAYQDFEVSLSLVSYVNIIVAGGRVAAGTAAHKLVRKMGTYKVVVFGYLCICLSLLGCSFSRSFWGLCISCMPLGFGDTLLICSLNTFTAVHFSAKHVNWMNMIWSLGSTAGPYVISLSLANGRSWNFGYLALFVIQITGWLLFVSSRHHWRNVPDVIVGAEGAYGKKEEKTYRLKGMPIVVSAFFCYLAIESVAALWGSSYIAVRKELSEDVAALGVTVFFVGMTAGRFLSGLVSEKLGDKKMIYLGQLLVITGSLLLFLVSGETTVLAAMTVMGLGCAPIFPCFVHDIPHIFGGENTGAAVGFLMAVGEIGALLLPMIFGWIAEFGGLRLFPVFLIFFAVLMMTLMLLQKRESGRK